MQELSEQDKRPMQHRRKEGTEKKDKEEDLSNSEDDESDLFVNTNHCDCQYSESDEQDDEEDENAN